MEEFKNEVRGEQALIISRSGRYYHIAMRASTRASPQFKVLGDLEKEIKDQTNDNCTILRVYDGLGDIAKDIQKLYPALDSGRIKIEKIDEALLKSSQQRLCPKRTNK